jgi:RimJ/RimL family protein N-acetyltransferase
MPRPTTAVALTPLAADDLPELFAWINDREQVLFNAAYRPVGESQHREWFESVQKRADTVIFAIRRAGRLIGTCQLHSISPVHRSAELQVRLGRASQRGKGYGTEAVRLLVEFAFDDLNLRSVYLHVFADNRAAIRAYEKAGFEREGLLREAAHVGGRYVDVVVMAVLRREGGG